MDGYSVTEAASVLGVPTERVWELLARGVLSGAPEGDTGMRVYLQPRPRPTVASDDPRRPNGDRDAEPEREASPFRELLTEFRGLTERYGQALLALGEARGEVAALRSRVDVLEARMDLRLPMGTGSGMPWPAPAPTPLMQAARSVEAPVEPAEPAGEHVEEDEHRIRRRGPRRATESFAEALARAEDPSIPELPAAAAGGEPMAAPRADTAGEAAVEPTLPRELPPAEMVPVAEEPETVDADAETRAPEAPPEPEAIEQRPEPAEAEPVDEPMVAVDVDVDATAREGAADDQVAVEVEPEPVIVETPEPPPMEPEPTDQPVAVDETIAAEEVEGAEPQEAVPAEAEPEPVAEEPEPDDAAPGPEPTEVEPEPDDAAPGPEPAEVEPEPVGATREPVPAPEPDLVAEEAEPAPIDFDAARYTTAIEDPDWFEAEVDLEPARTEAEPPPEPEPEVGVEPADASEPPPEPELEPEPEAEVQLESMDATEPPPEPDPEPEPEVGVERAGASEPPPEPEPADPGGPTEPVRAETDTEDEETMLWFGRRPVDASGADEMEVAGSGSAQPAGDSSAAAPLPGSQELDEAMAALEELRGRSEGPAPQEPDEWPPASTGLAEPPDELATLRSLASPPRVTFGAGARPGSPATRAYRRLRRIFPG